MELKEIAPEIEKILNNTDSDKLTDFTRLTESRIYLCVCAVLEVFIRFLDSLSSRFAPVVEILTIARNALELLKKEPEDFRKKESYEEETETVHCGGHYVKAHDITRSCHNHPNKDKEDKQKLEEENRSLRVSVDDLKKKDEKSQAKIEELESTQKKLEEIIMEKDLQLNSKTSHWPSSMNRYPGGTTYRNGRYKDYDKRMEEEKRAEASGQEEKSETDQKSRRGGQNGHKGYSGRLLENVEPDKVIKLYPEDIPQKDRDKYEWEVAGVHHTLDIKFETVVTEYQQMQTKIKGDRSPAITIRGIFPPQAKSEITYDTGFIWLVETYYTIGLMGMEKVSRIIRRQFGVTMSKSTVANILRKAGLNLRAASTCIAEAMKTEGEDPDCVYTADETDLTVGNEKYYDHVLLGDRYALHTIAPTRGLDGAFKSGVLKSFRGWLVTDFFGMYRKRDWKSAFDRAHLTRELLAAQQRDPECRWIPQMQEFFYQSYKAYHTARDSSEPVPREKLLELEKQYDEAVRTGKKEENLMYSKTKNLLHRFIDYKEGIIANLYNTDIYLTSNASERQCKKIKRRLDVSGHFESLEGAEDYAAALSVIETGVLQGLDSMDVLQQVLGGNVTYPVTGIRDDTISVQTEPIMTTLRDN